MKMNTNLAHRSRPLPVASQEMDWPLPPPVLSNEPGQPRILVFPALPPTVDESLEEGSVATSTAALIQTPQGKFALSRV